jgi:hypothetical protein
MTFPMRIARKERPCAKRVLSHGTSRKPCGARTTWTEVLMDDSTGRTDFAPHRGEVTIAMQPVRQSAT